jgi:hypothetical protein
LTLAGPSATVSAGRLPEGEAAMFMGRGLLALMALSAAVPSGCSENFKAVQAAGVVGQKIDGSVAFGAAPQICYETRAIGAAAAEDCAALQAAGANWAKIAAALAAYAAKLSALAGATDVAVNDQVNAALSASSSAGWDTLTSNQNTAISQFAAAVVSVLSANYRAGVLDDVIKNTDPHVQEVSLLLKQEIELRISQMDSLSVTALEVATIEQVPLPPAPTFTPPPAPPPSASASSSTPRAKNAPPVASKEPSAPPRQGDAFERWQLDLDERTVAWATAQASFDGNVGRSSGATLAMLIGDLAAKKHAYNQLEASIEAFRAAHSLLAKKVGNLSASELVPEVISVVQSAASVVAKLDAPLKGSSTSGAAAPGH